MWACWTQSISQKLYRYKRYVPRTRLIVLDRSTCTASFDCSCMLRLHTHACFLGNQRAHQFQKPKGVCQQCQESRTCYFNETRPAFQHLPGTDEILQRSRSYIVLTSFFRVSYTPHSARVACVRYHAVLSQKILTTLRNTYL